MRIQSRAGLGACLLCVALQTHAAVVIRSVQVTPADHYTQITFDADARIPYQLMTLHQPERLVLQLDHLRSTRPLGGLRSKLEAGSPVIRTVRIGHDTPDRVRIVFALKDRVKPVVMVRAPAGRLGHQLVLKLYPARQRDPLAALIAKEEAQLKAADDRQAQRKASATRQAAQDKPVLAAHRHPFHTAPAASARRTRAFIVAIDAGHGGQDPGAHGPGGTDEKQVTLAIARKLKAELDTMPGLHGVLVRDGDYFIPLHQRIVKAQRLHADLFVSIHADSSDSNHTAQGSSVYALSESGATSVAARLLARQENDADRIGGIPLPTGDPYLAKTLLDLSQTATINDSLKLGNLVLHQLGEFKPLHNRRVEQAGFAVLKSPEMPSILIETDFINNPAEERKLANADYQRRLAQAIAVGVHEYLVRMTPRHALKVASDSLVSERRRARATD